MLAIEPVEVNLVKVSDTLRLVKEADSPGFKFILM